MDALVARELSYAYTPGTLIVDHRTLVFPAGSMTALTGPSGCGKSTLLYLLALMLKPRGGEVCLNGRRVDHLSDAERAHVRAESFGFVFQDAALDPTRSVLDNVTETALYRRTPQFGRARRRAVELMERFGVDIPPTRKPTQISGGQAQRIALCRALLHAPPVVFADEPTGNLDPVTTMMVVDALREHAHSGMTVVAVTHSPQFAQACDEEIRL